MHILLKLTMNIEKKKQLKKKICQQYYKTIIHSIKQKCDQKFYRWIQINLHKTSRKWFLKFIIKKLTSNEYLNKNKEKQFHLTAKGYKIYVISKNKNM